MTLPITPENMPYISPDPPLPLAALLALAMTGFLALLTETLPAGMLSQISASLKVSDALSGQLVTGYALGSLLAAIPLIAFTRGWRRRSLLLTTLISLMIFNLITALASHYLVILVVRFMAGMAGGLIWGMLVGYARRMVPDSMKGRALAIVGLGAPLALSLGVPIGAFLSAMVGWRIAFILVSALTLIVSIWIILKVPDYAGESFEKRVPVHKVFTTVGVRPVLTVLIFWILAHSILYTYIMPFLVPSGLSNRVDAILLVFGFSSLIGIGISGFLIDRLLRKLVLGSLTLFALASFMLGVYDNQPLVIYCAVMIWGISFGGSATLLQTALAETAGSGADVAQAILVTVWNLAIALGGIMGGLLLAGFGSNSLPFTMCFLVMFGLLIAWRSKHGFPLKTN